MDDIGAREPGAIGEPTDEPRRCRSAKHPFEPVAPFYAFSYPNVANGIRREGTFGASIMPGSQPAGDWPDAATPDLVITSITYASQCRTTADFGGGRFDARSASNQAVVKPAHSSTGILVNGDPVGTADVKAARPAKAVGRVPVHSSALFGNELLMQMFGRAIEPKDLVAPTPTIGGLAPWQCKRVTDYLHARIAEDVSLNDLAAVIGLSVFHFARAFRKTMGVPPHTYLRRIRCDHAKALLVNSDSSITNIAFAVGYASSQAFARMFMAETTMSPSAYRREKRR